MQRSLEFPIALILSALFCVALVYAMFTVPVVINGLLRSLQYGSHGFLTLNEVLLAYAFFMAVFVLIFAGFVTKKRKLAALGSISFYLPVFGYFACTMFLMGLGVILLLWVPLMSPSLLILRLGEIMFAPFLSISLQSEPTIIGYVYFARFPLTGLVFIGIGVFVFFMGALTWLYARFRGSKTIGFWIYRYSRHPQYLGFLLWSYGMVLLPPLAAYPRGGYYLGPPSFPWLIAALTIIGVALHEENVMVRKYGHEYSSYREHTPFMMPLPKQLSALIAAPARALLKKKCPANGKEIILTMIIYGEIVASLSLPLILMFDVGVSGYLPWWQSGGADMLPIIVVYITVSIGIMMLLVVFLKYRETSVDKVSSVDY